MIEHKEKCMEVRKRLKEYCLPYKWLQAELSKRGVSCSTTEISDTLTCHRTGTKAELIANISVHVLDGYSQLYIEKQK